MKKTEREESPSRKPTLKELQLWMRWVMTDPRGVSRALENEMSPSRVESADDPARDPDLLARYEEPEPRALSFIEAALGLGARSSSAGSSAERIARLNVYAEGYFSRLLESLSLDFPKTKKLLGEEFFGKLVGDYLKLNPSRSRNIGDLGKNLPHYSEHHFLAEAFPWLSDLLRLERNETLAFFGGQSEKFKPADFSQLTEENLPQLKIKLHPAIRLQSSAFRLHEAEELEMGDDIEKEESFFVVYRAEHVDDQVRIQIVSEMEFRFLEGCLKGEYVFDLFASVSGKHDSEEEISTLFSQWMERGWIQALLWDPR